MQLDRLGGTTFGFDNDFVMNTFEQNRNDLTVHLATALLLDIDIFRTDDDIDRFIRPEALIDTFEILVIKTDQEVFLHDAINDI